MRLRADQRLFLTYVTVILVVVVSLLIAADSLLRRRLTSDVETQLARELALGRDLYDRAPAASADESAQRLAALSGRRVTVIAPEGTVIGESSEAAGRLSEIENHAARPEVRAALAGSPRAAIRRSTTLGREHMYLAVPTARGDILRFAVPLAEIDRAVAGAQRGVLGAGSVALLLAVLFSLGFSVAVTRPLRRMQSVARTLAAGDLSPRLRERRRDELGDLARALDALADQLQGRLAQLEGERVEMQALIDSMSEGVLAFGPRGRLRRANPAARRIFALPEEPAGIAPEAIARRPDFLRLVGRALRGETVRPTELETAASTLLFTGHPLPGGGAVVVILDVTELRRLESVRRDFVANASHELKTPLTAIRGYSETLLDPELPPETARKFAAVVKQSADRLQRIVDDLLDLSRIESGHWRVQPLAGICIEEVARDAWNAQQREAEARGLRLEVDVHPAAERVTADPAALSQILANLFSNAIRYGPEGSAVSLSARPVRSGAADAVRVEVSDTGQGIPAVHLPRIFERFYRSDPARSREAGGTGLGLAIVKHLVEAHGGTVSAGSAVGAGTTIAFTLPHGSVDPDTVS